MRASLRESETMRLARTLAQLRPSQAGQRLRLRGQRLALDRRLPGLSRWLLSGPSPASAAGWPAGFTPNDGRIWRYWTGTAALAAGRLNLLGADHPVAPADEAGDAIWRAADWELRGAPLLWRYHAYYWDWAWALAAGPPDRRPRPSAALASAGTGIAEIAPQALTARAVPRAAFAAMWESWHAVMAPGRGPAWHPYPAALRAWSFCGIYRALAEGSPIDRQFVADLAVHAGFLRRHLETDVGGNHLIKNLKALAGLAVFFDDARLLAAALGRLRRQLAVQVLPDGGHYERAPAYHCQVLGDLIDIDRLLRAAGREAPGGLDEAIQAMRHWLGAVLTPAGDVPILNDGFPVSPDLLARLAPPPPPVGPLLLLPDSGLARGTAGGWHLLADIGPPCPRELPAHAHADSLSCLVFVDGKPLLVDAGTSTYAPGAVRDRERSTAAHNTLEVDGRDSTEVWGAFRAGRRARVLDVSARVRGAEVTVEAAHDGYRSLPGRPLHRRRWTLGAAGLRVDDTVTGRGRHRIVVRWQLTPGAQLRLVPGGAIVTTAGGRFRAEVSAGPAAEGPATDPALTAVQAEVGAGFGCTLPATVLTCALTTTLPAAISTVWRRAESRQEPT